MARLIVSGADTLLAGLEDMERDFPELRAEILKAEADVVEPIVRQSVVENRLVRTGALQRSISRKSITSGGVPTIRIGPTGEHHRYLPSKGNGIVTAGRVGYIYEYGIASRGISARQWLSKAVEKAKAPAYDAADAVCDKYLKKHNL